MSDKPPFEVNTAETVDKALGGMTKFLPVAEKNLKGGLVLLAIIGVLGATLVASLYVQRIEVTKKIEKSPLLQSGSASDLVHQIREGADGTKEFEINN